MFSEQSRPLKVEELALMIGVSVHTINNWYRWKAAHPENEMAKLLPDYFQDGARQTRYWKQSDVFSIIQFHKSVPKGRNGFLGDITQKAWRKKQAEKKGETNGKETI